MKAQESNQPVQAWSAETNLSDVKIPGVHGEEGKEDRYVNFCTEECVLPATILQMCGGCYTFTLIIVALMRREGMKKESRRLSLRGAAAMALATILTM